METRKFNQLLKLISTDENSFNELYRFYGRRIVFHLSRTYGREIAEDVSHDFFLKLITNNQRYEYIEKPTSWVYKCCENIAKTKIKTETKYEQLNETTNYKEDFFDNIEQDIGLDQLDDISRRIIELFYWEGYNLKEISEILHIKYATVRKRHSRAKLKIKKYLNHCQKTKH